MITILKRDGSTVIFDKNKVFNALKRAFISSAEAHESLENLVNNVINKTLHHSLNGETVAVEMIQDEAEESLMMMKPAKFTNLGT